MAAPKLGGWDEKSGIGRRVVPTNPHRTCQVQKRPSYFFFFPPFFIDDFFLPPFFFGIPPHLLDLCIAPVRSLLPRWDNVVVSRGQRGAARA